MNPSVKKEMKTDAQREVLERSYEIDRFPQEHARQELARKTGLTEKQVVVWFSHRRRKDRKAEILSGEPTNITGGGGHPTTTTAANLDERDARVAAANAARAAEAAQAAVKAAQEAAQYARDVEARIKQKREDQHAKIVQKLGFAPRADGPRCALSDAEFDPLPPGAFGAKVRRPTNNTASAGAKSKRAAVEVESQAIKRQRKEMENQLRLHEKQAAKERELARRREEAMARERAKEEERMRKEHERSVRAMEKLAAEQMRREAMFEREHRREEEKLERERLKLEERRERERRREEERLERERMKEEAKEARRVELEDRKRERDEEKERERERREKARALIALGPPDDEALELESLRVEILQAAGHLNVVPRTALQLVTAEECPAAACDEMEESIHKLTPAEQLLLTPPVTTPLPRFPPPAVRLVDSESAATLMGCAAEGVRHDNSTAALNLGDADWPDLLEVWSFVNEFSEATGCTACTLSNFATALIKGSGSNLLATIHIKLLQTVLADMNEAHAQSSQIAKTADELQGVGSTLREAWSWVFDVDAWRAHLNHMTWPEVMRQFATAAGHGKYRPGVSTSTGNGGITIGAGYTTVEKAMDNHGLLQKNGIFQPPTRFQPGSVRAFCWVVLEKIGHEGMSIPEIAKAISEKGFRDLRSTKTIEASLVGALSRDPTFVQTAHSTYALRCQLIVSRQEAGEDFADLLTDTGVSPADLVYSLDSSPVTGYGDEVNGRVNSDEFKNEDNAGGNDKEIRLINVDKPVVDADWVRHLEEGDYDTLTLRERLDAFLMLVHTALDGGAVRGIIESRVETCNTLRKSLTVDHISKRKAARLARRRAKNSAEGLVMSTGDGKGGGEGGEDDDEEDEGPGCGELSAEDFRARHALAEKIRAAEEEQGITIRHAPIALDRRFNRYWCFATDGGKIPPAADGSPALLYLEHAPGGYFQVSNKEDTDDDCRIEPKWSLLDGAGAIASLVSCLDPRGRREQALYAALHARGSCAGADGAMNGSPELFGAALEAAMPTSPPLPRPAIADDSTMEVLAIRTVAADITSRDAAAPLMLAAKRGGNPPSPAALRLHKIRAEMLNIIRSLPQSAFQQASEAGEEKKRREQAITTATTITELRNALARLQEAISPRYFSASFVLRSVDPTVVQSSMTPATKPTGEIFIPATSAALALHVLSLDAALNYSPSRAPARETLASYIYIQRPANTALSGMRKGMTKRRRSSGGPSALKVVIKKAGGGRKDTEADQDSSDDGEARDNRLEGDDQTDEEGEEDDLEEEVEEEVDDEEYEEEEEEEEEDEYIGEDDDDDEDFCA